jgi:hypothetical protein
MRADAVAETRAPAGLVVLEGQDRQAPWFDAEALVWTGARSEWGASGRAAASTGTFASSADPDRVTGDVLVLALRLREPHGLAEVRGGRFVFTTGAIRPIAIDGVSAIGRLPWGLTLEAVGGAPVIPRFGTSSSDWMTGGRVAQHIGSRFTLGASYVREHGRVGLANEELGADMAAVPYAWLDVAGRGAYDLTTPGVAEAYGSAAARLGFFRVELFGTHRSPSRLLPATSLFSVLGDFPSQVIGTTVRWDAAPRLDLLATAAGQDRGGDFGGYGALRGTLRLDDQGNGTLALEGRRQDIADVHWAGIRAIAAQRMTLHWRASSELEVAWADDPHGQGAPWPWGIMSLGWRSGSGWEAAAGIEAGSTPLHRFELDGLVRLSRTLEVP